MGEEKILIVDDEKNIATLLQAHLEMEGYKTVIAYNGDTAFKKVMDDTPDLIILDIMLPKMDGWEVCQKIREKRNLANIPIIMLTAKTQKEDIKRGWKLGVTDYITKPFSPSRLVEVVKKALLFKNIDTIPMKQQRKTFFPEMTNIAVVGTSQAGISIIQFLIGDQHVNIKGIADNNPDSALMLLAKKLDIFSTTDIRELCKLNDLHLIFMLSHNNEYMEILEAQKPLKTEIVTEETANFIWYLIEQSSELEEKERSLVKDLNSRTNELEILYEGSKIMGSTIDMNSTLKSTIETMAKAVKADNGLIILLDEETDEWSPQASFNFSLDILKEKEPLNMGQGIARLALKKKQAIAVGDVSLEKHRFILSDIPDVVSTIVLPLFIKDKAFGVAYLNHSFYKEYTEAEIHLLSTLAGQASVALENARLYETVKQKHHAVEQLLSRLIDSSEGLQTQSIRGLQEKLSSSVNETVKDLEKRYNALYSELNQVKFQIEDMKKISIESLDRIYGISEISLPPVESLDLMPALEDALRRFEAETGIVTELIFSGVKRKLGESIETTIYRIIQEAFKNVKEHSGASNVRVRVKILSDQFNVAVEDDGIGFEQARIWTSLDSARQKGLNSIKEKASFLGGTFKIRSHPGRGTSVLLRIPIPSD